MLKICKIGISTELQSYRATELQSYRATEERRDAKTLLYLIARNFSTIKNTCNTQES
ncbi:MAG: hypothetical protein M9949_02610 [Candidatus Kapabacteria bacterium]|nr:hypothetical protein [Candidatus Kapabacteria bacterium]